MRFKDVFSIIGPNMVGPSSSHTAGAVRLGRTARHILGDLPEQATIVLYGSFASTYQGHGTDLAIVAGLLDFDTDDDRIKDSLLLAEEAGVHIDIRTAQQVGLHPNTALMILRCGEREVRVMGCSIGGGNIEITSINHFDIKFTAMYPTLLIFHDDRRYMIADITDKLKDIGVNIGYMEVDRKSRNGEALTVIEIDEAISQESIDNIASLSNVHHVCVINLANKEAIS